MQKEERLVKKSESSKPNGHVKQKKKEKLVSEHEDDPSLQRTGR